MTVPPEAPDVPQRGRRYPRGRGSALKTADRMAIGGLALSGLSGAEIARRLGRSERTISRVLNSAEFTEARELAKSLLASHATDFAYDWIAASKVAALSGRHEGCRDALLAIGAIEPPQKADRSGERLTINIGVALPGLPSPQLSVSVPSVPAGIEGEITQTT